MKKSKPKVPLNIDDFIRHPDVLNDSSHSEAQLAVLKSLYGQSLSPAELEIHQQGTGKAYDGQEKQEATIIAGRRSGKTSKIAAGIVIFEAFWDHGLSVGEPAFIMLLARTLKQAGIAFRYIHNYLRGSKILSKCIISSTKDEIRLKNGVTIGCYAATYGGVRGRTVIAVVADEIAFWPANSAAEVIAALRPAMVTIHNSKLIKISTPHAKSGLVWEESQHRGELDFPVWRLPTAQMNPTIAPEVLAREMRRNEEKFRREFQAQFTDSIEGWVRSEHLDPCIVSHRSELPFQVRVDYCAALDPASRRNDFALAILHKLPDDTIVVDRVARWAGTKNAALGFEFVLGEVRAILETYGINSAIGDQYYCDAIAQHLQKLGIYYKIHNFNSQTRAGLFSNLKHLLVQKRIELLDDPDLLRQLRNLRQEKT
jgi:terminase large subunit-like protein